MTFDINGFVRVYRALPGVQSSAHARMYTIEQRGEIVGHVPVVTLRGVIFHVDFEGWRIARRSSVGKLHAYALGYLELDPRLLEGIAIDYSPLADVPAFRAGDRWVKDCGELRLDQTGCMGSHVTFYTDLEVDWLRRK